MKTGIISVLFTIVFVVSTPAFWPGEFHGLYSPWGCKELDKIEQLSLSELDKGFPGGASGKALACQYRRRKRCRFNPWVGKIP